MRFSERVARASVSTNRAEGPGFQGTAMKNFGRNFALIGILTLVGLLAIWPPDEKLKLGIDLSGGTILVYQAKDDASGKEVNMDDLISALKRRVNPEGVLDIPIRKVGSNRVEIILPEANPEEVDEVKRRITQVGSMEFRILADRRDPTDQSAIDRALRERSSTTDRAPRGYRWASLGETIQRQKPESGKRGLANWVRLEGDRLIDPIQSWTRDKYVGARLQIVQNDADGKPARSYTFPVLSNDSNSLLVDPARAEVFESGKVVNTNLGGTLAAKVKTVDSYALVLNPSRIEGENLAIREVDRGTGITEREVLYKDDRYDVTGEFLANVYPTQDERVQPAVGFVFNARGANKFRKLTREHAPREDGNFLYHLAILLDDVVMSAPVIRQEIGEQGIIENMQPKQVDELINILRAGSLPASIDPIPLQEEKIGPTLGKDTIQKGVRAIFFSMLAVPIFMIAYYRFAGVVAVIALILNMILLIGSMAFTGSSFTLPGLAGLSLTIGMAVDANVLIFERMREEAERGREPGDSDPQRVLKSLDHHSRLERHDHAFGHGAVVDRHRGDQGLRAHAHHRSDLEPVHRRLCLAGDVRVRLSEGLDQAAFDGPDQGTRPHEHQLRRASPVFPAWVACRHPRRPRGVRGAEGEQLQHRLHRRNPGDNSA